MLLKGAYCVGEHFVDPQCVMEIYLSYFSTKTYVVGIQKDRLTETVLLSSQNTCLY